MDGNTTTAIFDPLSSSSFLSPSFYHIFGYRRFSSTRMLSVAVRTTEGLFSCLVNFQTQDSPVTWSASLGRDWFNYCTTAIPSATVTLDKDHFITFSAQPCASIRNRSDLLAILSSSSDDPNPASTASTSANNVMNENDMIIETPDFDLNPTPSANVNNGYKTGLLNHTADICAQLANFLSTSEYSKRDWLDGQLCAHGLNSPTKLDLSGKRCKLSVHITSGECATSDSAACKSLIQSLSVATGNHPERWTPVDVQLHLLGGMCPKLNNRPLRRILECLNISYDKSLSVRKLRRVLKSHIASMGKAKLKSDTLLANAVAEKERENVKTNIRLSWPQLVPDSLKEKILRLFKEQTSSESLKTFSCAVCGTSASCHEQHDVMVDSMNLDMLRAPLNYASHIPMPMASFDTDNILNDVLMDPNGVVRNENGKLIARTCQQCYRSLTKDKLPPLALANRMFLGSVPPVLADLTPIEEAMIAKCQAKCWVIQLKDESATVVSPDSQRGIRGHIIIYPQNPSEIAQQLPPSIDDVMSPICVLFVGSSPPSLEWLRQKAKPLTVRREKVRQALIWLKKHNPLYRDIIIDHAVLDNMQEHEILPFCIQHVVPSDAAEAAVDGYTNDLEIPVLPTTADPLVSDNDPAHLTIGTDKDMPYLDSEKSMPPAVEFEKVVIMDVDGRAPSHELRAAALRHVKNGGGYIEIPHHTTPANEFFNPDLFPLIYPTLFPYGVGGFEDKCRTVSVSMKRHVKHLCSLTDKRFQEHYSFMFVAFNVLQRRLLLLNTSIKVKRSNFDYVSKQFAAVSPETVHIVTERISRGDTVTANNDEERKVLSLMKQVNAVTSNVPGSAASKVVMRNEIRALMIEKVMPSFFITINPADVYNPIVKFLAGTDIDINNLQPTDVPTYWEQSMLIAKNPFIAAKFFNLYMKAFISTILRYDPEHIDVEGGALGLVKAYYGCVEAQGRGTLHCHMMVWLDGALNPNEIKDRILRDGDMDFKDRLIRFLDDSISNSIPPEPDVNMSDFSVPNSTRSSPQPLINANENEYHPCTTRGPNQCANVNPQVKDHLEQRDFCRLVKSCQVHRHSKTCYKYWKGPPSPKECRFDMDEGKLIDNTTIDLETGEITYRCLDGLVNNFNETIIKAVCCNMDIKFIGSGPAAKSVIYYVTNYITKSQLKTHVAFAALELAVQKLGVYDPEDDELTVRAKKLLQKCAYSMISHQELSAQQVASYLMDYEDHFKSHKFRNLMFSAFEAMINKQDPSPECYASNRSNDM
ncbi:hypothetical protein CVT24_006535 [Panaeolus cyanescens]|uniref:Uncharacterized protein n=1 Tax=Panaeolus cyanescens TaxID=181874 RepID=A0A409WNL1_9AGAR|nr:hypothetical protein CVT24_006535 [Panaeolus cyanescens]